MNVAPNSVSGRVVKTSMSPAGEGKRTRAPVLRPMISPNRFERADIIAGLAHLKPTHSFRSHYAYDNLLYIVAGKIKVNDAMADPAACKK